MSGRGPSTGHCAIVSALLLAISLSGCGGHQRVAFTDIQTGPTIPPEIRQPCGREDIVALEPDPGDFPSGVPFPTPSGDFVEPGITGIPLPDGSVQIDGFTIDHGYAAGDAVVQVFEVSLSQDEVLAFFDVMLLNKGWSPGWSDVGPAGAQCAFRPSRFDVGPIEPSNWIIVSTAYVPRNDEPIENPGFRGKGVPYAPRTPGKTTFSILTPK
ncbi:MAG: hypothetical protein AB7N24_12930 [Dehalococcoidia bacterium]